MNQYPFSPYSGPPDDDENPDNSSSIPQIDDDDYELPYTPVYGSGFGPASPYPEPGYSSAYQSTIAQTKAFFDGTTTQPTQDDDRPSLPVILISAACGIAGGSIGLYAGYVAFSLSIPLSAGIAALCMLFGLGISGAVLSAASQQRNAFINMAFSCTLIVLVVLFMTMCATVGAIVATLIVRA